MDPQNRQPEGTVFTPGWSGFTTDWFSHRIQFWLKHVVPEFKDKKCHWLEIGSYEGRSATWTLTNILTHPDSSITCIDPWLNKDVEKRFLENIKVTGLSHKVDAEKGFSHDVLPRLVPYFDVVYVDGDHQAKSAMADAVLAWRLLRPGGVMIFDDYRWNYPTEAERKTKIPACKAIDAFLSFWQDELELIHKDYQVIIRKKL